MRDDPALLTENDRRQVDLFERFLAQAGAAARARLAGEIIGEAKFCDGRPLFLRVDPDVFAWANDLPLCSRTDTTTYGMGC
jgi:hypothetical protein